MTDANVVTLPAREDIPRDAFTPGPKLPRKPLELPQPVTNYDKALDAAGHLNDRDLLRLARDFVIPKIQRILAQSGEKLIIRKVKL
jgi:hypothetical protein